ncbi:hypothetical protein SO694_0016101 [Aureococcus anophagefferens]|uniref:Uncharacterized protein n=1 Tax=Aureococcus anophagefferens TaxID=44056 RepID=A0ABR1G678_AURAN
MIARPKISRNEWKTAEIGALEVGKFAPFSGPGTDGASSSESPGPSVSVEHDSRNGATSSSP